MMNARPSGYDAIFQDPKFHGHYYDGIRGLAGLGNTFVYPPDYSSSIPTPILADVLPPAPSIAGEYNPFSEIINPTAVKQVLASDFPTGPPFSTYTLQSWFTNPLVLVGVGVVAILLLRGKR